MFTGCTSIATYSQNTPEFEQALIFKPIPDKSTIYVYRLVGDYGSEELTIDVNGKEYTTVRNSFFRVDLDPGIVELEAHIPGALGSDGEVEFQAIAGKIYSFEMRPEYRILIPSIMHLEKKHNDITAKIINTKVLQMIDLGKQ